MKYLIHESKWFNLERKLNAIGRKCGKMGIPFKFEKLGNIFKDSKDGSHADKFRLIDVEGTAIVSGWQFIGRIDSVSEGKNVVVKVVEVEIPKKYFSCALECDCCHKERNRNSVYIVRNEKSGEFATVGSRCVLLYTGGLSAEECAMYASLAEICEDAGIPDEGEMFPTRSYGYKVLDVIRYAIGFIHKYGYKKTSYGVESTRSMVINSMFAENRNDEKERLANLGIDVDSDAVVQEAKDAIAWAKALGSKELSEYELNLKALGGQEYVEDKHLGFIVSLPVAYGTSKKSDVVSEWQGEIGKRITFRMERHVAIASYATAYGLTTVYQLEDKSGNVYIYKTGSEPDFDNVDVTATVKSLDTYKNVRQTVIQRARFN